MTRFLTVAVCLAISVPGFLLGLAAVAPGGMSFGKSLVVLTWLVALIVLLRMAGAWIAGKRLGRIYSANALLAGCIALLALPVFSMLERPQGIGTNAPVVTGLVILAIEIVAALPSIALAAHLNRFHAGNP